MTAPQKPEPLGKRTPSIALKLGILCLVTVVCGAAITNFLFVGPSHGEEAASSSGGVPVSTVKAQLEDFPVYLDGLGTVQALYTVAIKTRVDGELQQVLFTEGQDVKKGDLLAVIDPRPYQAALDQAVAKIQQDEADLANGQYLLAKDQKLAKQGVSTDETVEMQQSQVNQLQAQLAQDQAAKEAAEISLSYTNIRSPIDGRTGIRMIDAGNQVHATDGTGIVTVTQTEPISVISTLREDDLDELRAALRKGTVEVAAMSGDLATKLADGTLLLIDNEIDQDTGTLRVKSTFPNTDRSLWPGQFVNLRILVATIPKAITVPSAALQRGTDGYFVYVVDSNDLASVRKVTPGPIRGGRAVINSGVGVNDQVVTQGQYRLEDGTTVSQTIIVPSSNATAEKD
ncbi:efflux RND transporter periplasmic adaptor subunit [Rhizobium laguerreae]|uniref:efflux RND transporter periplasmic adaptor subunit n=1 Tax=Rhizobium laguerreae TaxID=1076926 RepID=UPI001C900A8B|nr:efflux RND transporter periplasmic adaptor subunit [Rhizobium laguerreae]MBY3537564.1 efflux RND transporter periplasmic adaptor subunit [Rhizobium laguerreae]